MTPKPHDCPHCAQTAALAAEMRDRLRVAELLLHITQDRMVADSLLLGTDSTHLPEPGEITAATRLADEAALTAMEPLVWTPAERLALDAMTADADGEQR